VHIKTADLRINVWDAGLVIEKIRTIVFHCLGTTYCDVEVFPSASRLGIFWQAIANTMNMFYPDQDSPQRPSLSIGNIKLLFDNGITAQTDLNNYPGLYISGVPYGALKNFEANGLEVMYSADMVVITFRGRQYRYGIGLGSVETAVPIPLTSELLRMVS